MRCINILSCVLLFVSAFSHAGQIEKVMIFHNDANPVRIDTRLDANIIVDINNLDDKNRIKASLNKQVKELVRGRVTAETALEDYQQAFSKYQNSEKWPKMYSDMEKMGEHIVKLSRYKIEKIPAILFNEKSIVYGVSSLKEAIRIYRHKGL